ncbi:GNAT family acetyltransferase [Corynebacterium sp. SA-MJD20WY100]|uniref:GNAT family acetyltransferase n=1 Tax=Corynebacterium sp. SA-MJD20WY100 TaxID=3142969 RepID=UPI00322198C1
MRLIQVSPPAATLVAAGAFDPSDVVRSFVFASNLAAQEATGDPAASVAPERVLNRLKGSTESTTLLFAAVEGPAVGEVGELGLPTTPAAVEPGADSPLFDYRGYILLTLPLLEEKGHADIEHILDVDLLPLPGEPLDPEGEEVARWLAAQSLTLMEKLGRDVAQVGLTVEPEDPFLPAFRELGFERKHREEQIVCPVPEDPAVPLLPHGLVVRVWEDYDIPDAELPDVLELLTVAGADTCNGALTVEPVVWTAERLRDAAARLRDRKAHTLLVGLESEGRVVAMSELAHQEHGDPEVAEWTLTVTARDRRGEGLARLAQLVALREVRRVWPEVTRAYGSFAPADAPSAQLARSLGAQRISAAEAWELKL